MKKEKIITVEYYKNLDLADIKYFCEIDLIEKIEEWRDIQDFIDRYMISDLGRIKSLSRPRSTGRGGIHIIPTRIMRQSLDRDGYLLTGLRSPGLYKKAKVHREVAIAFIPNPENKPEVNHVGLGEDGKEGNKFDNRVISLRWSTGAENMKHASENDLLRKGESHKSAKLTEKEVLEIRASNLSHKELSIIYNTGRPNITQIINRQRWKHI